MSIKLYDLTEAYQNILNMIDEEDADFTQALQAIEGQIEVKAVNIANLIKSLEAEADMIKAEEQRLAARRKARESAVGQIKAYLQYNLEATGKEQIKTPTRTISIQNNPWSVDVIDESLIPEDYFITKRELSKSRVKEALTEGKEVPGAMLQRTRSVRIR